ncbi:MAG: hypothetical protein QW103_01170 [Candidatus Pacearchaeota archaeon]
MNKILIGSIIAVLLVAAFFVTANVIEKDNSNKNNQNCGSEFCSGKNRDVSCNCSSPICGSNQGKTCSCGKR